jgi:DMSO/TMAO reductase YedYZ molybdopterin-dependent catalytic subunit
MKNHHKNKKAIKILFITLLCAILAGFTGFFSYFIYSNEAAKAAARPAEFVPSEINIAEISDDLEFAKTIPQYRMLFTGYLNDELDISFEELLVKYDGSFEQIKANGVRSDDEEVTIDFFGIKLNKIIKGLGPKPEAQNAIIYATDLYAANFSIQEITGDDLFLVWKKDGQYLNPGEDGVLKIVLDNGPTKKWVKNPVVFDFIGEYKDRVEAQDKLADSSIDFVTEQQMFTLSLGGVPEIDISSWELDVGGLAQNPYKIGYDEMLAMPQISVYATLETISNPAGGSSIGNAVWTGVPLKFILEIAGIKDNVIKVIFFCEDGYSTAITVEEALKDDVILAYKMNGKQLAPEHGYPLRLVVPGKYGMKWPKWINKIELTDIDYKGYWESQGWSDYAGRDRPDQRFD